MSHSGPAFLHEHGVGTKYDDLLLGYGVLSALDATLMLYSGVGVEMKGRGDSK